MQTLSQADRRPVPQVRAVPPRPFCHQRKHGRMRAWLSRRATETRCIPGDLVQSRHLGSDQGQPPAHSTCRWASAAGAHSIVADQRQSGRADRGFRQPCSAPSHLVDMALGATVRPWKEVVGWKPWAVATKSAPYNAVERITMLTLNSEADPQLSLCLETAYIKFSAGGRRVDAELEYLEKLKQRRSGNFPRTLY